MKNFKTVEYRNRQLIILDQTLLPAEERYVSIRKREDLYDAVKKLMVRGAPAIGVAVAYGICAVFHYERETIEEIICGEKEVASKECVSQISEGTFYHKIVEYVDELLKYVESSRPTAVNLFRSTYEIRKTVEGYLSETASLAGKSFNSYNDSRRRYAEKIVDGLIKAAEEKSRELEKEDVEFCRKMGEHGLTLLKDSVRILTHCNAGALATAGIGTCLAPIYLAAEKNWNIKVYADETRPLLQGARLTSWELGKAGIDVTLICDNMAASLMAGNMVDCVMVGCDRMAENGDGANKIGTLGLAVLAHHYGIPFYMFVPSSTIDMNIKTGDEIKIEMRPAEEITKMWYSRKMAGNSVEVYNPSFDVTPNELISAVVTEKGVIYPPYKENFIKLFKEKQEIEDEL